MGTEMKSKRFHDTCDAHAGCVSGVSPFLCQKSRGSVPCMCAPHTCLLTRVRGAVELQLNTRSEDKRFYQSEFNAYAYDFFLEALHTSVEQIEQIELKIVHSFFSSTSHSELFLCICEHA